MKCETCEHKEVCGKKEAYKTAYENLNKDVGEFEIDLKCKHYKSNTYFQLQQSLSNATLNSHHKTIFGGR